MSVSQLLKKLKTRPLIGGLALGETPKITTNAKRARKTVTGSLDEIARITFSSPKDLIEHLMLTVSVTVRDHSEFAQIVEKIKTDSNTFEHYRSMSKTEATRAVSSEVLKTMLSDFKELTEEGKKLKADRKKLIVAINLAESKKPNEKGSAQLAKLKTHLQNINELVKEYNQEHANLSRGIKKIGVDSDDPDHVKSLKDKDEVDKIVSVDFMKEEKSALESDMRDFLNKVLKSFTRLMRDEFENGNSAIIRAFRDDPTNVANQINFSKAFNAFKQGIKNVKRYDKKKFEDELSIMADKMKALDRKIAEGDEITDDEEEVVPAAAPVVAPAELVVPAPVPAAAPVVAESPAPAPAPAEPVVVSDQKNHKGGGLKYLKKKKTTRSGGTIVKKL